MQLTWFTRFADVESIRSAWDDLAEAVGGDIYSSFDWCAVWWRHYGRNRKLRLGIVRDGERLVAVLPLFCETLYHGLFPVRVVRVVGCDHSVSSCNVSVRSDYLHEVPAVLVDQLCDLENWDMIHFGPLSSYFVGAEAFAAAFESNPQVGAVELDKRRHGVQTLVDLPEDYDQYLRSLKPNERRDTQRRQRRLAEQCEFRPRVVASAGDLNAAFNRFVCLHHKQWTVQGRLGHFGDWPDALAFHRDMLHAQSRQGRPSFAEVWADSELLAAQYEYQFGRRVHWLLSSRTNESKWDRFSPGRLVHLTAVRHAIDAGARQIDDMQGRYRYKMRLGGRLAPFLCISVLRRGQYRHARVKVLRSVAALLNVAYYRVWFSRLSPRMPYLNRPLWDAWIRSRL